MVEGLEQCAHPFRIWQTNIAPLPGEPIICTPADVVQGFFNTGMHALAIGNFLVWVDQKRQMEVSWVD